MKCLKYSGQSSGLEGFQIFRMLDKEHQKEMMGKLSHALQHPVRVDFIKANTIVKQGRVYKIRLPEDGQKSRHVPGYAGGQAGPSGKHG